MKIAEFTDSFLPVVDGVGRVVLSYANCLAEQGHECYVMAPMNDIGFRGGQKFELIDFHSVPIKGIQQRLGLPIVDTHFHSRMKNIELDIIHVHSPFTAGQAALTYAKRLEVPLVGTFHSKFRDDFYEATGINMVADVGARFVADYFDKCDEVWTVSEASAETLRSYGFKKKIIIMPNGTMGGCACSENEAEVRRQYSLGEAPVFLFAGQMDWKKNIELILQSAQLLAEKGHVFKLVLAGQGAHAEEIALKAESMGLADRTVMTGHIYDFSVLSGLYKLARLFVFPSLYDTAGLVVSEAAQCGTPAVVIRSSGPAESISDRFNGMLCDNTADSLANSMEFALTNPEDTKRMGEEAIKTIPVNMDDIIKKVIDRYEHLIEIKKVRLGASWKI